MTENKTCNRCCSRTLTENNLKTCTKCREYFKQSRLNNRDEINEKAKERYQENKEVKIERSLKWQAENIDKLKKHK